MFNESQLFSVHQFLRVNGLEVNYNEGAFIFMREKKIGDSRFFDYVSCRILSENMNIVNEKLTYAVAKNRLVWLQYDRKFIFTHSYRLRKLHIYTRIHICRKMLLSYNFFFEGKFRKYDISIKRKHKKLTKI